MSKRRRQHQQPRDRTEVKVIVKLQRDIENMISLMQTSDCRRKSLWFPTGEPGYKLLLQVREDIPIGQSAQDVERGHEDYWHPINSCRYFSNWNEAMRLVQALKHCMEVELRTIKESGRPAIYRVSGIKRSIT